jgi:hypothetical protein
VAADMPNGVRVAKERAEAFKKARGKPESDEG